MFAMHNLEVVGKNQSYSSACQSCHQHISSPTFVTKIDVAYFFGVFSTVTDQITFL